MRSAGLVLLGLALGSGCAINPATGRLQFNLVSSAEEAALGRELDEDVRAAVGLYPDAELRGFVAGVGERMAAGSERKDVEWTFRVLDDESVNAFALPGGYVYVTRGLLAHLQTEGELAGALGHEIGHVTARHGANQYSRAQVAARSVGVFRVVDPGMRHVGAIAAGTAQLRLLRYSREHELEADDLGIRYMDRAGYSPGALTDLLGLLGTLAADQSRPPAWLATHPEPEVRMGRLARSGVEPLNAGPEPAYLERLQNLAVGPDPRDGYVTDERYVHPRAGFSVACPPGWERTLQEGALMVTAPNETVMIVVGVSSYESVQEASDGFFSSGGLTAGKTESIPAGDFTALSTPFAVIEGQTHITGVASFIDVDGRVLLYVAFGAREAWDQQASTVARSFASLARPTVAESDVQPARIEIATVTAPISLRKMVHGGDDRLVPTLARLNRVDPDETLDTGRPLKLLRGAPATR